jgi:hypothetical protein
MYIVWGSIDILHAKLRLFLRLLGICWEYVGNIKRKTPNLLEKRGLFLVDNSTEISNISFTSRDLLNTIKSINFILESDLE